MLIRRMGGSGRAGARVEWGAGPSDPRGDAPPWRLRAPAEGRRAASPTRTAHARARARVRMRAGAGGGTHAHPPASAHAPKRARPMASRAPQAAPAGRPPARYPGASLRPLRRRRREIAAGAAAAPADPRRTPPQAPRRPPRKRPTGVPGRCPALACRPCPGSLCPSPPCRRGPGGGRRAARRGLPARLSSRLRGRFHSGPRASGPQARERPMRAEGRGWPADAGRRRSPWGASTPPANGRSRRAGAAAARRRAGAGGPGVSHAAGMRTGAAAAACGPARGRAGCTSARAR
jgi:hypothetical protein